ncbi:MAG: hypothetical protein ABIO94_06845 [Opitutaceae bacterium]
MRWVNWPLAKYGWIPATILLSAGVLRVALAWSGGQYFFGDEERYDRGIQLYFAIAHGDLPAVRQIAALPEHALFPWIGALVTAGQHGLAQFTPYGTWENPGSAVLTIKLGAVLLSLFSTANLFLTHRLARIAGGTPEEANWALLLMAASNTAFYYARHLLPYECAITSALLALVLGLQTPTAWRGFACGIFAGACYHLYNGYWYLVPVVWSIYVATNWRRADRARLWFSCTAGLLAAMLVPMGIGWAAGGPRYFQLMVSFSQSVTQGAFAEGWSLPWEYLWHSEMSGGAFVAAAFGGAVLLTFHHGSKLPSRVRGALSVLVALCLLLGLFSAGLKIFVVYARTVKPWIPVLCLLGGWALATLSTAFPSLRRIATLAIVLLAAINFAPHFTRVFPRETEIAVLRSVGNPKRALSVSGSLYIPLALPVARPDLALVNAQLIYPARDYLGFPTGETLLKVTHPLSYPPFQYESHHPRERQLMREHDISMRLIKLTSPRDLPDHPPPELLYRSADRPTGR